MNKKLILVVVLLLGLAAGGYYFVSASNKNEVKAPAVSQEVQQVVDANEATNVKEFTVDGSNFAFSPKEIKVSKGDTVKITFKDIDGMHNLVIDGYNVKTNIIKGGSEDTITFVADKTGQFEYYCSVGNHKESGMTGTFIVE